VSWSSTGQPRDDVDAAGKSSQVAVPAAANIAARDDAEVGESLVESRGIAGETCSGRAAPAGEVGLRQHPVGRDAQERLVWHGGVDGEVAAERRGAVDLGRRAKQPVQDDSWVGGSGDDVEDRADLGRPT